MTPSCSRLVYQGRNRHIFLRGQSHFPDYFPGVKCIFPVRNSHFGRPKTIFRRLQKLKAKKKKKKKKKKRKERKENTPLFIALPFPIFHLPFYNFPSFLLNFHPFSLFPCLFFPIRQQNFPGQKSLGGTLPPCPRLLRHFGLRLLIGLGLFRRFLFLIKAD